MKVIIENAGIQLLENEEKYYIEYDAGAHMIKRKRIEILKYQDAQLESMRGRSMR